MNRILKASVKENLQGQFEAYMEENKDEDIFMRLLLPLSHQQTKENTNAIAVKDLFYYEISL
ncbi:hypothetical protein RDI58_013437 [Solanum bulbocastanum]|uniref:Uncharacterized protein n=1 Tax=Solanum bulbocastanum TaxID=147425 RepID=A0AAN8TQV8_SOLBU